MILKLGMFWQKISQNALRKPLQPDNRKPLQPDNKKHPDEEDSCSVASS